MKTFFNLSKASKIIGQHKNPKMPKNLEHQDFSESAQNVWAEMKLFSTFTIFLGQNKIPKLPEIFEHPLRKKRKGFSPNFSFSPPPPQKFEQKCKIFTLYNSPEIIGQNKNSKPAKEKQIRPY
jgi:hypothetical protein